MSITLDNWLSDSKTNSLGIPTRLNSLSILRHPSRSKCPYCGKLATTLKDSTLLPNRNFKDGWWHDACVARFITDNTQGIEFDFTEYVENLKENMTELIKKVNAAEKEFNYKKIILTV